MTINKTIPWQLCLGVGLLGGFIGIPVVRSVLFVARVSGWPNAIEGIVVSLLWAVGVGLGIWLLRSAIVNIGREPQ